MDNLVRLFLRPLCMTVLITLVLSSCASMDPTTAKRAYCNTLKSNIVFNGATSIDRESNIQASEKPLQQSNYDNHCSDQ